MARNAALKISVPKIQTRGDASASRLAELADTLSKLRDHSEILVEVSQAAVELTGCQGAALLLIGASTERTKIAAVAGETPFQAGRILPLEESGLAAAMDGAPRLLSEESLPATLAGIGSDVSGAVVVPLLSFDKSYGALVAVYDRPSFASAEEDLETLRSLGTLSLPAAASWRTDSLERRVTETLAIVEVGQVLTGLLAMDDVLSYVIYLAEALVGGHCATIGLLTDDRTELVLRNSSGSLRDSEGFHIPVEGSLMGWVVKNDEMVITSSVSDDSRSFSLDSRQGPGIVVPIKTNGVVVGAFLVARHEGSPDLTEGNANTLQRMSAYAAIAINNARIHREQQDTADRLTAQAAELQTANEQLERSKEHLLVSEKMAALGKVTAGIAHEINSPLGSILNSLRLARGYAEEYESSAGDPDVSAEDHRAIAKDLLGMLDLSESAAKKVASFVRSIKSQTRSDSQAANVPFDPAREIDATVMLTQHQIRDGKIGLFSDVEAGLSLTGDPAKFALVLQNLISNAIDAYDGRAGEVWIRMKRQDESLLLQVEDRGSGIPEDIRNKIFDYLFTTKDVGKGTGLGLSMVHSIVTSHFHGQVELISEVGRGTTFQISLPAGPAPIL